MGELIYPGGSPGFSDNLLRIPDEMAYPPVSPADVPLIDPVDPPPACGAKYGRVHCYKAEGHKPPHAGMSRLEWS